MGFLSLLKWGLPWWVKYAVTAALIAGAGAFGWVKGAQYEQNKVKADNYEYLEKQIIEAKKQAKADRELVQKHVQELALLKNSNKKLRGELSDLLNKPEKQHLNECSAGEDVKNKLNELLK